MLVGVRVFTKALLAFTVVGGFVGVIVFAVIAAASNSLKIQDLGAIGGAGGLGILAKVVIDAYFSSNE